MNGTNLQVYCRTCAVFSMFMVTMQYTQIFWLNGNYTTLHYRYVLILYLRKNIPFSCQSHPFVSILLFGADWELHQREHEGGDGPAAAERRPQPHGSHVGNGHQPSVSDGRTDTQANWRWDAGNASKRHTHGNALKHIKRRCVPFSTHTLALRGSILCSVNPAIPWSTAPKRSWPKTILMLYRYVDGSASF